jgi:hypothetical protein
MAHLVLIRGLPGSGKTYFATRILAAHRAISADDYFEGTEGWAFNHDELPKAPATCQEITKNELWAYKSSFGYLVVVHNTFSQRWELQPYLEMVRMIPGTDLAVIDLFDGGYSDEELFTRNIHHVPLATIQAMRAQWEHDWRNGNPER